VISTLVAPVGRGRHRLGRLGLIPVTSFVDVIYRGLFLSWRQPGKHRPFVAPRVSTQAPAPAPAV
jgi:hypothetical protein